MRRSRLSARIQVQFEPRSAELRISKDSKDQHRKFSSYQCFDLPASFAHCSWQEYALSLRQLEGEIVPGPVKLFPSFSQPIILGVTRTANQPKLPRFFQNKRTSSLIALALHVLRCLMSRSTELVLARGHDCHDCCDCYDCHDCHDFWIQHDTAICQMLSCFTPTIWRVTLKMKKKRTVGSSVTKGYSPAKTTTVSDMRSVREGNLCRTICWTGDMDQTSAKQMSGSVRPVQTWSCPWKPGKGLFECMPPVNISLFAVR